MKINWSLKTDLTRTVSILLRLFLAVEFLSAVFAVVMLAVGLMEDLRFDVTVVNDFGLRFRNLGLLRLGRLMV